MGYEVYVGNIGTIDCPKGLQEAIETFEHYKDQSENLPGCRAYGEDVAIFKDGEIFKEHNGHLQHGDCI